MINTEQSAAIFRENWWFNKTQIYAITFFSFHNHVKNIPPKCSLVLLCKAQKSGETIRSTVETSDFPSFLFGDYITTSMYILGIKSLFNSLWTKSIHKNIMSFTKYFSLFCVFCILPAVFQVLSLLFSIKHVLSKNSTDISQIFQ